MTTQMRKRPLPQRRFIKPSFSYLIEKKRDGGEFSQEEIRYIIDSTLDGEMPQHQLAALLMAIYFANMSAQETAILTEEMMLSGEVIDLSHISKPKIDKYSTGGVGDKTSLVLVPLAMASGVVVPMMCGLDQEYVINTLDKLGAVPGFRGHQSIPHFVEQLGRIGGAIVAQVPDLAPADAKFYALRKETGTIPSLPLITGSVLSRKLAEGSEGLVIDVKWGNGSFIRDLEQAKQLARSMTRVGRSMKRRCVALVTDMNQPLGDSVGTGLEVREAIQLLKGQGPEDAKELVLKLGMEIVRLAGVAGANGIRAVLSSTRAEVRTMRRRAVTMLWPLNQRRASQPPKRPPAEANTGGIQASWTLASCCARWCTRTRKIVVQLTHRL